MSDFAEGGSTDVDIAGSGEVREETVRVIGADGVHRVLDASRVEAFTFRQPGFLSQRDTGQLGVLHRRFLQDLSARLSTFLRMEVSCDKKSLKCASQSFKEFCDSVEPPTHLTLFQVSPFDGIGVLELRPNSALALANRLLGGKGVYNDIERNPTEIEVALLDELVVLILKEWISVFEDGPVGTALVVGHESNTRFLQMASDESPFFVLSADLCIGEVSERMQLAVPFPLIDALTNRLTNLSRRPTSEARSKPLKWRAPFAGISVELSARWSVKDVTLGEILNLSAGDLIELPQDLIDRTEIVVSGTSEFVGTVGVDGGRLAVYLNDRVIKE